MNISNFYEGKNLKRNFKSTKRHDDSYYLKRVSYAVDIKEKNDSYYSKLKLG